MTMKLFTCCMIFCGCSIDGAFYTKAGTVLWLSVFAVGMISAAVMAKKK